MNNQLLAYPKVIQGGTYQITIYLSGSIEKAKSVIREFVFQNGLCVTINPTTFIYTGGEEEGYAVGILAYPRFSAKNERLDTLSKELALKLLQETFQWSALVVNDTTSIWMTLRKEKE